MKRRMFLGAVAASGSRILSASEPKRAAIIGSGNRGRYLTGVFKELGADMAAVCDVYEPNLQKGLEVASTGAKSYVDYRRVLDDKSIHVVLVATPDHTHAQIAVDAANAGKDLYIEKPMATKVEDSFRIVEAVRRNKCVAQVGNQRRSWDLFQEACAIVNSPEVGPVRLVNGWWLNSWKQTLRGASFKGKIDWDKWLGPARKVPPDPERFFNWEFFWDYTGGMMVAQSPHIMDEIQWFMKSTYPTAVTCSAGQINIEDSEIPETTTTAVEFPENYLAIFTVGYKAMKYNPFGDQCVQYHGNKGRLDVGRESYVLYPEDRKALDLKPSKSRREPGVFLKSATVYHVRNFLECLQTRKDPNATVEMGSYTSVIIAMAIESLRTRRRVRWDAAAKKMV
jgi:predicted dehydrogenase